MKPSTESYSVGRFWRSGSETNTDELKKGKINVASFQNAIRYSYIEIIKCSLSFKCKKFSNKNNIQVKYRYFLSNSNKFRKHDESVEAMSDPDEEEFKITVADSNEMWVHVDLTESLKRKLRKTLTYMLHVSLLMQSKTSENSAIIVLKTFGLSFEVRAKGKDIVLKNILYGFKYLRYP